MSKLEKLIVELCPNGVEYFELNRVFMQFNGMTGVSNKWAESGNCKFIDYMNAYKNLKIDVSRLENATVKKNSQNILLKGDILLTCASETPDECAVSSVIEDEIENGVFLDDHLFGIRLKEEFKEKINTSYVNYYFHNDSFRKQVNKTVRGVTRFYIANDSFMKLEIPVPPLPIQEEIVRILDNFTELTAELTAELQDRKKQYEYYRENLLTFSNYVNKFNLSELCEISTGSSNTNDADGDGLYPFFVRSQEPLKKNEYEYDEEAIITAGDGVGVGKVFHYIKGKYALHQRAYRIHPISKIIVGKYLYHYFVTIFPKYIQSKMYEGSVPSVRRPMLNEFIVFVPSIEIQNHIVDVLDNFEKICNDLQIGLPAEIELRQKQYEYYRDKLLTFKRAN